MSLSLVFKVGAGLLVIIVILLALSGNIMSYVEEPKFKIVASDGDLSIREYPPTLAAEVKVTGPRLKALNQGFGLIANYIFGNNISTEKMAMTAPVTQQPGEKIAMTAPVTQQGSGETWVVRFIMPAKYTLETLPAPKNQEVKLVAVPTHRAAVIRFSGENTEDNLTQHRAKLLQYVADHHLVPLGEPIMAFYNPPWTLPFLRRNEIILQLQ